VATRKRAFWFSAEGDSVKDGTPRRFSVYRQGRGIYISTLSPHPFEHLCPSRLRPTERDVVREIKIVFDVTNVTVAYPTRSRPA
jgi:hypothetical protein